MSRRRAGACCCGQLYASCRAFQEASFGTNNSSQWPLTCSIQGEGANTTSYHLCCDPDGTGNNNQNLLVSTQYSRINFNATATIGWISPTYQWVQGPPPPSVPAVYRVLPGFGSYSWNATLDTFQAGLFSPPDPPTCQSIPCTSETVSGSGVFTGQVYCQSCYFEHPQLGCACGFSCPSFRTWGIQLEGGGQVVGQRFYLGNCGPGEEQLQYDDSFYLSHKYRAQATRFPQGLCQGPSENGCLQFDTVGGVTVSGASWAIYEVQEGSGFCGETQQDSRCTCVLVF